ncbi:MAG: hypothetical protein IMW98_04920 [Firmicutes bacterium]|nr:hypothetical protein [Bacillota bacterium]
MKRKSPPSPDVVWLGAALADVKDDIYRNMLGLAAVMEALVAKGIVSREELSAAARRLEEDAEAELAGRAGPGAAGGHAGSGKGERWTEDAGVQAPLGLGR